MANHMDVSARIGDPAGRLKPEQRFSALVDALPDMMFVIGASGEYLDFHAPDPSQLVTTPDNIIGRNVRDLMPPDLAIRILDTFERARNSSAPVEIEYDLDVCGERRRYEARIVHRADQAFVCIVRDVSARVRLESMAHEIERLHFELAHAGRLSLMGRLTASLIHELSQPLTAVLTNAEVTQRMLEKAAVSLDELRQVVADVVLCSEHAVDVLDHLRGFLRKRELRYESLDPNQLVSGVALVVRNQLASRGISLAADLAMEVPEVLGDRVQLQQVLLNLVLNAADAVHRREGAARSVTIRTHGWRGRAEIAVSDRGTGVDPADMQRIFQPFFSSKADGLGMGLAICADIIRAHRGRIDVRNNPEGGATFSVRLPRADTRLRNLLASLH